VKATVVGGGLAGLAAALELADGGAEVTLHEARGRLGGATFSFERNGLWLDNGQHVALRCCTAYLDFLRRIGSDHLLPLQARLDVPVLREGKPAASISRTALPAPLHLAASLLAYAPLTLLERMSAVRAALALKRLDPDDRALDAESFGDWLRAHGQTPNAIASLWNLIALPTLNLPADEASLASAVKVFRTGLLDTADAADIGIPSAPFQRLHADPAQAALEAKGGRVVLSSAVSELDELLAAGPVVLAVPPQAAAAFVPVDVDGLGESPIVNLHVHYDRRVLDERFAAAEASSPLQWLFDRTESGGVATGQLVSVSLSGAAADIGEPLAALRERYVPALERLLPKARGAEILDFTATREPRATFRGAPGTARLRPGARTSVDTLYLAGAWTDTGWPATMESAVRSGLAAAAAARADLARGRTPEVRAA
jgi:hydroxysqualene dehydroxylase